MGIHDAVGSPAEIINAAEGWANKGKDSRDRSQRLLPIYSRIICSDRSSGECSSCYQMVAFRCFPCCLPIFQKTWHAAVFLTFNAICINHQLFTCAMPNLKCLGWRVVHEVADEAPPFCTACLVWFLIVLLLCHLSCTHESFGEVNFQTSGAQDRNLETRVLFKWYLQCMYKLHILTCVCLFYSWLPDPLKLARAPIVMGKPEGHTLLAWYA